MAGARHLIAGLFCFLLLAVCLPLLVQGDEKPTLAPDHSVENIPYTPAAIGCAWTGTWVAVIRPSDLKSSQNNLLLALATPYHKRKPGLPWLVWGVAVPALAFLRRRKQIISIVLVGSLIGLLTGCEIEGPLFEEISIEMKLSQTGDTVSGTYTARIDGEATQGVGQVQGTVSGNTLTGTWRMDEDSGEFVAIMSADCSSLEVTMRQEGKTDSFSFTFTRVSGVPLYEIDPGTPEGEPLWIVESVYLNDEKISAERTLLYKGGKITTGPGVTIKLRYHAGALVTVHENSEFVVEEIKWESPSLRTVLTRLIKGIVDFYTKPTYNEQFEIETERAITSIKGTELTVEHTSGVTKVSVKEGEVEVKDKTTGIVTVVRAGETVRFDGTTLPAPPPGGEKTIEQALDANNNKIIDDFEMLQALEYWIKQQIVPGTNKTIDDLTMLTLLEKWIKAIPIR